MRCCLNNGQEAGTLDSISTFLQNFDMTRVVTLLIQIVAALLCVSFHEMATDMWRG